MAKKEEEQELGLTVKKGDNFSSWYDQVLEKAGIVDLRYPIKGMPVHMPFGFGAMRACFRMLEELLERSGHRQVLFPILVPEELFSKEAEHIKGFEEEIFWATHGGKEELERKMAIRPTSETIIYPMLALWIRSYADMPMRLHQTCTIYRHETKATRPLIRGREVYWNEAHTAHATFEEAEQQVRRAIEIYTQFYERLGIPFLALRRPVWDKFPGAIYSVAFDAPIPDGKVMQIATAHNLGENFSRVYGLKYADQKGENKYVNLTCYGISMRCLAATIAIHGDDKGLVLPPNIAPIQIAIVPVYFKGFEKDVNAKSKEIKELLEAAGKWRVEFDGREDKTAGFKFNEWELKGACLRIEVGPRDIKQKQVVIVRRDTGDKVTVSEEAAALQQKVHELLLLMEKNLANKAQSLLRIVDAASMADVESLADGRRGASENVFIRAPFHSVEAAGEDCANKLQEKTGLHVRGVKSSRTEKPKEGAKCIVCGGDAAETVYLARAY